jgi:Flp pilus assembly protein TadG
MVAKRRADRERGSIALLSALTLAALIGFVGLAVDYGRAFHARTQLQAGLDAGALAAVKSLNGTSAGIASATTIAPQFAVQNSWGYCSTPPCTPGGTGGVQVSASQISFGNWDGTAKTFTVVSNPSSNASAVNAVKIDRTTSGSRETLNTTFSRIFGKTSLTVGATAVAVGGGPAEACGFPLIVADCALPAAPGCNDTVTATVSNSNTDTAAWTDFLSSNGAANDNNVNNIINGTGGCGNSAQGDTVRVTNGVQQNNLDDVLAKFLNQTVTAPVFISNASNGSGGCNNISFNGNTQYQIGGYIEVKITGVVTTGSNKGVTMQVVCGNTTGDKGGGTFRGTFGQPTLAQ